MTEGGVRLTAILIKQPDAAQAACLGQDRRHSCWLPSCPSGHLQKLSCSPEGMGFRQEGADTKPQPFIILAQASVPAVNCTV